MSNIKLKHIIGGVILLSCGYGLFVLYQDSKRSKVAEKEKKDKDNKIPVLPLAEMSEDVINPVVDHQPTEAFDSVKNDSHAVNENEPHFEPANPEQFQMANDMFSNSRDKMHMMVEGRKAKSFLYRKGVDQAELAMYNFDNHQELVNRAMDAGWDGNS